MVVDVVVEVVVVDSGSVVVVGDSPPVVVVVDPGSLVVVVVDSGSVVDDVDAVTVVLVLVNAPDEEVDDVSCSSPSTRSASARRVMISCSTSLIAA